MGFDIVTNLSQVLRALKDGPQPVSGNDWMMQKLIGSLEISDEDLTLMMHKYEKEGFRAYRTLFIVVDALVV